MIEARFRPLVLTLSALLLAACPPRARERSDARPVAKLLPKPSPKPAAPRVRVELHWDPKTGKGDLRSFLASGDVLRVCLHCGFKGYTGGLVIGSQNGSGFGLYPRRPIRGFRMVNVFCAQDESIWDRDERAEYSYGWSENFGTGDDGKRLEYVRGRVLEGGPARVVLQSENAGGCYRVTKLATMERGARHLVIATRISNRCDHPLRFDLWSGDDPWIGLYASSDGDVGWIEGSAELIRHERALGLGAFTAGGLYDLGNAALGQKQEGFSNQANVFLLDPATPLPDLALFANRFAHKAQEVDPKRPLDNKTMTALNLGWIDRQLAPGEGFTVAFALGLAETGEPGSVPRPPAVSIEEWSRWRHHLSEGARASTSGRIEFAAERVELKLEDDALAVRGSYWLRNTDDADQTVRIEYPVITAPDRPPPQTILVDGKTLTLAPASPTRAVAGFAIPVPPRGLAHFEVRYRQLHRGRVAAYMVTSARSWPGAAPVGRAVFVIDHAASRRVRLSYPPTSTLRRDGRVTQIVALQPFAPTQELELRW